MTQARGLLVAVGMMGAMLALGPSSALGADWFVDRDTGDDANLATNCQQANPCETIGPPIGIAGANDTIRVDDSATPYELNNQSLFGGISVVGDNFVGAVEATGARPIVNNSGAAGVAALAVNGTDTAGTISGLTVRPNGGDGIRISGDADAVRGNVFEDPGAAGDDIGIRVSGGSPLIENNAFTDLSRGVAVLGGNPAIVANDVSGARQTALVGNGISIQGGSVTLERNTVHDKGAGAADGIVILGPTTSTTLSRNRVSGHQVGVNVDNADGLVTMQSDLVSGNSEDGISVVDSDDSGDAVVNATNVTVVSPSGADSDVQVNGGTLNLDSSIVGAPGSPGISASGGTPTCSISFSRGPTAGAGCNGFQTTANPQFVNTAVGNFHLLAGSAMIDAGNPAAPPGGALDIDGQTRALDGNGDGVVRRDIGADEAPTKAPPSGGGGGAVDTTPPETSLDKAPKKKTKTKKKKLTATFEFSSEPGASFECSLDDESFEPCSAPHKEKVKKGKHTFEVRASDAAGNVDPTPAKASFKVKKKKKRKK